MLSCKDVSHRADALIDGELGVWDKLQVWMHLAMCKSCTAFVAQMRTTRDLIQTAPNAPADGEDAGADAASIDAIFSRLHDQKQSDG
jgi:anti-sigma factor RsiW